jgi:hypothetical protein
MTENNLQYQFLTLNKPRNTIINKIRSDVNRLFSHLVASRLRIIKSMFFTPSLKVIKRNHPLEEHNDRNVSYEATNLHKHRWDVKPGIASFNLGTMRAQ